VRKCPTQLPIRVTCRPPTGGARRLRPVKRGLRPPGGRRGPGGAREGVGGWRAASRHSKPSGRPEPVASENAFSEPPGRGRNRVAHAQSAENPKPRTPGSEWHEVWGHPAAHAATRHMRRNGTPQFSTHRRSSEARFWIRAVSDVLSKVRAASAAGNAARPRAGKAAQQRLLISNRSLA